MYSSHVVHVHIFAFGPFSSVIVFCLFDKKKKNTISIVHEAACGLTFSLWTEQWKTETVVIVQLFWYTVFTCV